MRLRRMVVGGRRALQYTHDRSEALSLVQPRKPGVFDCANLNTYPASGLDVLASPHQLASSFTCLIPGISGLGRVDRCGAGHRRWVLELASLAGVMLTPHTSEENLYMDFDISDIVFLLVVLSIAIVYISNSSSGGGGHRAPVPTY